MLTKGVRLALELHDVGSLWAWVAPGIGIAIGVPKVIYMYDHFCKRNLDRIAALKDPKLWQFFRPGFFVFLASMIALAVLMSRYAMNSFAWLVFIVALDFSLATGLLVSMRGFFRQGVTG